MKTGLYVPKRLSIIMVILSCTTLLCAKQEAVSKPDGSQAVKVITSSKELSALIDSSGSRLLMFDLYADWCMPCKLLSPMIEKIASDMKDKVSVYKINIDKNPEIANAFQVTGIPYVVMIKKKTVVQAFMGVQSEDTFRRAISNHAEGEQAQQKDRPDGELVNGVRTINLPAFTTPRDMYVYRGEEVKLVFGKAEFPFSVHVPAFNLSGSADAGEKLELEFKANEAGVFPIFCNGKCPLGDGQQFGKIIVLEYEVTDAKAIYKSVNVKKANEIISAEKPLILDVRTPNEFFEGYIPGAKLIPVQQLADRVGEIEAYKNTPVVIYCRSGNRSIVASQILIKNGFKQVYNVQGGIKSWEKEKLPINK